MGDLRSDTELKKTGANRYASEIARAWEVWGPNGGYLSSLLLRAVGMHTEKEAPLSFAGQYLRVPDFGEATVEVNLAKDGKNASAYQVRLLQEGDVQVHALIWVANAGSGPEHQLVSRPEHYVPLAEAGPRPPVGPMRFWENLEIRQVKNSGGYYSHWYRFDPDFEIDDPFLDGARSLVLIDSMQWPARYYMSDKPPMYVGLSLDLYVQFHRFNHQSKWLFSDAITRLAYQGTMSGQATVWDEEGELLASGGSQSALRPMPKPH